MTKTELIKALDKFDDDEVVVICDENGGWDNIINIDYVNGTLSIVFGGGSPFTDE